MNIQGNGIKYLVLTKFIEYCLYAEIAGTLFWFFWLQKPTPCSESQQLLRV